MALLVILSETRHFNESLVASFIDKLCAIAEYRRGGLAGPIEPSGAANGFETTLVPVAEWPPPRQIGDGPFPSGGLKRDRSGYSHDRYRSEEDVQSFRMVVRAARRRDVNRLKSGPECRRRSRLGRFRRYRRRARPGPKVDRSRDLSPDFEPHIVGELTARAA